MELPSELWSYIFRIYRRNVRGLAAKRRLELHRELHLKTYNLLVSEDELFRKTSSMSIFKWTTKRQLLSVNGFERCWEMIYMLSFQPSRWGIVVNNNIVVDLTCAELCDALNDQKLNVCFRKIKNF